MRTERERDDTTSRLTALLVRLAEGVHSVPWLVLTLVLATCTLCGYFAWTRLEFHTQRSDLISPHKDFQKRWLAYLDEFGDDDDMVVVVQGGDRKRMLEAVEELAAQIEARPRLFDRLFYKVDLRGLRDRALMFLPKAEVSRIHDSVKDMGLLLEPPFLGAIDPLVGWKQLTLARLLHEARRRADKLPPGGAPSADDLQYFTQLAAITAAAAKSLDDPASYASPWQSLLRRPPGRQDQLAEPQYFFSDDGSLAFLLVRPVKDTGSFTLAKDSVEALRRILEDLRPRYPEFAFGLTGLPVLEHDEMTASQSDSNLASWLALAGVALLYLVVFRSYRYPLLTVSTLVVGTVWAMGWLTLTVGHLNILSATFAVMLIGMGDYGILWVTRYDQERAAGANQLAALRTTAAAVGPSIVTAAVTASLAFFAAMLADFQAIVELGWIAGSGILMCGLSCLLLMPALLRLVDRREAAPVRPADVLTMAPAPRAGAWLPALASRPRWVIAVSLLATAALGLFATGVRYDHNLLNLQAQSMDSVQWELKLVHHTAGASWHALSYTDTAEEALKLKERFEKLPGVGRVVEVASLVPPGQAGKVPLLRDVRHRLRRLPERGELIPGPAPAPAAVAETAASLKARLRPLQAAHPAAAGPLCDALGDLSAKLTIRDAALSAKRLARFEQLLRRDLAEDLHRLREVSMPVEITLADLPPCLRERHVGKSGKWLLRVFGKDSLWEYGSLRTFVNEVRTVDPEATGKPLGTLECLRAMKHGFLWAGLYAFLAIAFVLLLDFRRVKHTLVALAPLGMGMVAALGVMALFDVPLNPANMIALPLILGVGADNGVHVLHDFLSRRRGVAYTLNHSTGRGIMVAALTTVLGFGTLMISTHRGMSSLGLVLTLGVTCCMLTALVFLPAVLRLLSVRRLAAAAPEVVPLRTAEPRRVAA